MNYRPVEGLGLYASYYFADRLFAPYNILEDQFLSSGGQVAQVPNYSLVDAGLSYSFDLAGLGLTLRFNMNNVFNETYIAELVTNELDDPDTPENEFYDNQGWFGFGRTWNTGLKIRF